MFLRFVRAAAWMVAALSAGVVSANEQELVAVETGDLPIIISAPHGGALEIPGVSPRKGEGLPTGGAGYFTGRDTGTEELARAVIAAIEEAFGRKPYAVIARQHRKFLDPNRPPEIAFEDESARPVYERYHAALRQHCKEVQQKFRSGLLLDIHGQGSVKDALIRGTKNGLTVSMLRERFGDAAHHGPESLFALLKARGWKVLPDPLDGREPPGLNGGYTVQTYGSHQGTGVDAVQLEFGMEFRTAENRTRTAAVLAEVLAEYAGLYLTVPPLPRVNVAVYTGAGTSQSLDMLLKTLEGRPRLTVKKVTADDIRGDVLSGCQVIVHPGGSGSAQGKALGDDGRKKVREFVQAGSGYVGVCAGAYLATCDYDWSLHILDAKVIDRKHWNRGFGTVEIDLTNRGRDLLGVAQPKLSIYYHQGPLLAPAGNDDIPDYEGLATFATEIAKNGAPEGVMCGTGAIATGVYGQGRVFCFSPHPERTEGQEQLLVRAVRKAAGRDAMATKN